MVRQVHHGSNLGICFLAHGPLLRGWRPSLILKPLSPMPPLVGAEFWQSKCLYLSNNNAAKVTPSAYMILLGIWRKPVAMTWLRTPRVCRYYMPQYGSSSTFGSIVHKGYFQVFNKKISQTAMCNSEKSYIPCVVPWTQCQVPKIKS